MSEDKKEEFKTTQTLKAGGPMGGGARAGMGLVEKPKNLPIRGHAYREDLPHTWLLISLTEGKYHQIRKMVSNVHHHCKRLIRVSIEDLVIGDLQPGEVRELEEEEFFRKLKIDNWRD